MALRLDFQPNFPREDISDGMVETLEQLLFLGDGVLDMGHAEAEKRHFLYRMGHAAMNNAAEAQLSPSQLAAFSGGISIYETLSTLVRPQADPLEDDIAMCHIITMRKMLSSDNSLGILIDSKDNFLNEVPKIAYVLGKGATQFWTLYPDYVISGAAVARQVELAAVNDLDDFAFETDFDFPDDRS